MKSIDVEEYEENFLKKYLEKKALKKIKKIESEIETQTDLLKIQELKMKIKAINKDLQISLSAIKTAPNNPQESKEIELQVSSFENDNNYEYFINNQKKLKSEFCIKHDIKNFDAYILENSFEIRNIKIPFFIYEKLFEFQKEGVSWLENIYFRNKGCILADEMGLGKTLQMVAFISGLFIRKCNYILIVSPVTLIDHWVGEFKKFNPFIRVCIYHKLKSTNLVQLMDSFKKSFGVLIISYEGVKKYSKSLNLFFDLLILDEGHKIKNKKSFISEFCKNLSCKSKVVITGTPMQNNLGELWNLFDFINPGLLGDYDSFKEDFEDKIKRGGYRNAKLDEVLEAEKLSKKLKELISPFILRRIKKEVAKLPNKSEKVYFCELTPIQEKLYKDTLNTPEIFDVLTGKRQCLFGIDLLRKVCNHCFLIRKDSKFLEENLVNCTGKMMVLADLLVQFKDENKKTLIFTQTVAMLNILELFCKRNQYKFLKMYGKTQLKDRKKMIDQFNSDDKTFIFLLTTKVGGLGLNLVGASRVIIYDPDWNPSTDNQAKERIYRYGQSQDVQIYKLITTNTIEEKILHTQIFKNLLHQKIFNNASISRFFNKLDLDDLFSYYKDVSKVNRVEEVYNEDVQMNVKLEEESDLVAYIENREKESSTETYQEGDE